MVEFSKNESFEDSVPLIFSNSLFLISHARKNSTSSKHLKYTLRKSLHATILVALSLYHKRKPLPEDLT